MADILEVSDNLRPEASLPAEEVPIGLTAPFHQAAAIAVRKAMGEIHANWDGSLSGHDVEAIHDLRVGTRRLRAALSVYEDAFPAKQFARVERAMSTLTDALGPARDTDVLIEHLKSVLDSLEPTREAERVGLQHYIDHLEGERAKLQVALDKAMRKVDLEEVAADLESVAMESS